VISISITAEAYEAIKATLPEAAESFPAQTDERSLIRIWLDRPFVDRLGQMRGPGESYSDVIMRVAKGWRPSGRLGGRFV
jgi:predicted CopG family antitoxin